jgi:hypothetical protein
VVPTTERTLLKIEIAYAALVAFLCVPLLVGLDRMARYGIRSSAPWVLASGMLALAPALLPRSFFMRLRHQVRQTAKRDRAWQPTHVDGRGAAARFGPNGSQIETFFQRLSRLTPEALEQIQRSSWSRSPLRQIVWLHQLRRALVNLTDVRNRNARLDFENETRRTALDLLPRVLEVSVPAPSYDRGFAAITTAVLTACAALVYRDLLDAKDFSVLYSPFESVISSSC